MAAGKMPFFGCRVPEAKWLKKRAYRFKAQERSGHYNADWHYMAQKRAIWLIPGMPLIDQTAGNRGVTINSAVTQERPVAADVLQCFHINFAHQDLFFIMRAFNDHFAEWIA